MGIVEVLLTIIKTTSSSYHRVAQGLEVSRREACKVLWNLAFREDNKNRIQEANGIEILRNVAADPTTNPDLLKNVLGTLWMFGIKDVAPHQEDQKPQHTEEGQKGHIMISYNWGVQPLVLKLAKALKSAGFKVWLDVEQMHGSTLERMAEALENSSLVLICVSEKYKDSPNCRLEGEYCASLRKPFIPLMMQSKYKPNGWLGILLGSRLYHRFADEADWDSKITGLINEIQQLTLLPSIPHALVAPVKPSPSASSSTSGPRTWKTKQVLEWLQNAELGHLCPIFEKERIVGKSLKELHQISSDIPSFIACMKEHFGITSVGDILLLSAELKEMNWI